MSNFTAEICSVWKILMKMCLVMVTIIKLRPTHSDKGNCKSQNSFVNINGFNTNFEFRIITAKLYNFAVMILQMKQKTGLLKNRRAPLRHWSTFQSALFGVLSYELLYSVAYRGFLAHGARSRFSALFSDFFHENFQNGNGWP